MNSDVTLFTIGGLTARIVRVLVGIPSLAGGVLLVAAGVGNPTELGNLLALAFGGGLVVVGAYNCLAAIRGKDIPIKLGPGKTKRE